MTYVVCEPCIGVKDHACVDVCPVECFYEGEDIILIHPEECIDCGACVPECPVDAIFAEDEVPDEWAGFIARNADPFEGDHELPVSLAHAEWEKEKATPGTAAHAYYEKYSKK